MPPLTCSEPPCKRRPSEGWAMCSHHADLLLRAFGPSSQKRAEPVRRLLDKDTGKVAA